ncbi:MAG TPA: hypothetical protein VHS99_10125 [Chloroflexota bacterium]|nr:hypothetical protein [Chloroflexota bacterium]
MEIPERMGIRRLTDEETLAAWRTLDVSADRTYPERPYIYLYATAIPLDKNGAPNTAADLANAKLNRVRSQATSLEVLSSQPRAVNGIPVQVVDYRESHRVPDSNENDGDIPSLVNRGRTPGQMCLLNRTTRVPSGRVHGWRTRATATALRLAASRWRCSTPASAAMNGVVAEEETRQLRERVRTTWQDIRDKGWAYVGGRRRCVPDRSQPRGLRFP